MTNLDDSQQIKFMNKTKITNAGYVGGLFVAAFFLVCSVWGMLLSAPELKELHLNLLRLAFPGFGFTFLGYVLGLAEAFVYGWLGGAFVVWLCEKLCVARDKRKEVLNSNNGSS